MNPFSFFIENDDLARKFSKIGEVTHIIGQMFMKMLPKSGRVQAMFANVDKSCRSFFFAIRLSIIMNYYRLKLIILVIF